MSQNAPTGKNTDQPNSERAAGRRAEPRWHPELIAEERKVRLLSWISLASPLTTRIANYRARPPASGAVSQAINGCAAQHSRKLLTFRANYQLLLNGVNCMHCRATD